jgi:hypothetical protein
MWPGAPVAAGLPPSKLRKDEAFGVLVGTVLVGASSPLLGVGGGALGSPSRVEPSI